MNVLVVLPPSAEVPLICSFSSIKGVFGHATVAQHRCLNVPTLPWMTHRCTLHTLPSITEDFFFFRKIFKWRSGMMIQMLNKLLPLKERLLVCSDSLFLYISHWFPQQKPYWIVGL